MAIYIFEGPDNSSKGTQISNLKKYLEEKGELVHVLHYSNIKGENIEKRSKTYYEQMFQICNEANRKGINLILDRAHIGETVYSPIYRNYDGNFVFVIEKKYVTNNPNYNLLVFIASPETLITRDDGLSFTIQLDKKTDEINKFKEALIKSHIEKKNLIDITNKSIEEVWQEVKNDLFPE
jgi:thymidylate kinase